jgi:threonine/homoserine/homoserine lactone efflux protein
MTFGENLWLFSILVAGGILVPGIDMIFVLANSLTRGRDAGLAATGGLVVGGLVHSLYAALGASLLANLIPYLYTPLAVVGGLYMVWIGLTLMRSSIVVGNVHRSDTRSNSDAFRRGVITCLLNPKAYLFMLAVYPQFLKPELGPLLPQASIMAGILAITQLIVYGGLALTVSHAQKIAGNQAVTIWLGRLCGMLLIAISAFALWKALVV